jgi:hypothetical protein
MPLEVDAAMDPPGAPGGRPLVIDRDAYPKSREPGTRRHVRKPQHFRLFPGVPAYKN